MQLMVVFWIRKKEYYPYLRTNELNIELETKPFTVLSNVDFSLVRDVYFWCIYCIKKHFKFMPKEVFWGTNIWRRWFSARYDVWPKHRKMWDIQITGLSLCISFIRPESEYFDSDYKRWNVSNVENSTSKEMLEYKIRRSSNEKWAKKENSSIQLPTEILALFDLFHAVSQYYEI